MKKFKIVSLGLLSISLLALGGCSRTCEDIKAEYKEEKKDISDDNGTIDDYDKIYKAYSKEFQEASCPGGITG
jgi:hypothetical protein